MDNDFFALVRSNQQKEEMEGLILSNKKTQRFGLILSEEDAKEIMIEKNETLKKYQRVEFGKGIMDKLIFEFCDSQYIDQDNYVETLIQLQDVFYEYKNEMSDQISDDQLLHFMKEKFETVCAGDIEYLEGTWLANFAYRIRNKEYN